MNPASATLGRVVQVPDGLVAELGVAEQIAYDPLARAAGPDDENRLRARRLRPKQLAPEP